MTGDIEIDNAVWYFDPKTGVNQTGLVQKDGCLYYYEPGGGLHSGWLFENGSIYYFDQSGKALTGTCNIEGESMPLPRTVSFVPALLRLMTTITDMIRRMERK